MLEDLKKMFLDRRVRITHTTFELVIRGACIAIHPHPQKNDEFNLELENGGIVGFVPEIVTENSVDGPLRAWLGGRRTITLEE